MRKNLIFSFILVALFSVAFANNYYVEIETKDPHALGRYLEKKGYEIALCSKSLKKLGVITPDPRVLEHDLGISRSKHSILSVTPSQSYYDYLKKTIGRIPEETYFNPEQTKEELMRLEKEHPQFAKVFNLNEWLGVETTSEGRSLYALQVSSSPQQLEDKPRVLLIGQHHARELMTHHAVLDAAKDILEQAAAGNTEYKNWIATSSIWFVPVVNPDGLNHVLTADRMWRKNRARNTDGSRGVDPNRNYGFGWGVCGNNSSNGSSQVYRGPSPMSEPEVQVMDKLNAKLQAQYVISYHSSGNEVLYPYRCGDMAEADIYYTLRDRLAKHISFGKRVASSSGEDYEHHYHQYGSISFLLEIGTSFQPSFSTYRTQVWSRVKKVLPFMLNELHSAHVHVQVKDASGNPIAATLAVNGVNFKEGEVRKTNEFGSYRWKLTSGQHRMTVTAAGYSSANIVVDTTQKQTYQVELEKSN